MEAECLCCYQAAEMVESMYDIVIVGGGPAGATLARLLGRKYRVLLLEKASFDDTVDSMRQKCCGGLIAPDAQLMLAKFGLGIPKSVLLSPQLFAVRTMDFDNGIERYYQRHYINIDRAEFDKWLGTIIPPEVKVLNNCIYRSFESAKNHVTVKFHHEGKDYEEKAKVLVGADGAYSKVRRQSFNNQPSAKLYISIQEWFETEHNVDYYGAIFDRQITDFYSWTIPKENYLILGAALKPDPLAYQKFELLKNKLIANGFEFKKKIARNGAYLQRPTKQNQICIGNDQVALIGEAAGFISPSSAEGLSYAFKSALALAKSFDNGVEGYRSVYSRNIKPLIGNIMRKNLKSPAMYNKYLRKFILKTGLLSIELEKI